MSARTPGSPPFVERRSTTVAGRIRRARRTIEIEVANNRGRYPFNHGRVTEAEVVRRAGLKTAELDANAEKSDILRDLEAWVRKMASTMSVEAALRDGAMARRSEERREQLEKIADTYQRAYAEFDRLRKRVKKLEERQGEAVERFANLERDQRPRTARRRKPK